MNQMRDMLSRKGRAGPAEDAAYTPQEESDVQEQLEKDERALAAAEEAVKGLPPGMVEFRCPDPTCNWRKVGAPKGPEKDAHQSHIKRHAHARDALEHQRQKGAMADALMSLQGQG